MNISKHLIDINFQEVNEERKIEYIVVHYTAEPTLNAQGISEFFKNPERVASAHYSVDDEEVVQIVEDNNIAYHCGKDYSDGKAELWGKCLNQNSIGIEMCCKKDEMFYITDKTKERTIELIKELMNKYSIPKENVVRHFDVCGKICPEPFVRNPEEWTLFKELIN